MPTSYYSLAAKWLIQTLFVFLPFVAFFVLLSKPGRRPSFYYRSVAILVLGDIGRSPRMMYHSESFAGHAFETFVIGYKETEPPASLRSLPKVRFLGLAQFPKFISSLPRSFFVIVAPLKVLFQIIVVVHALFFRLPYTPQYIIVQNPPTIPTLAIVQCFVSLRNCRLIIDWHNLGYSILSIRLGKESKLVKIAEWFERTFGRSAYAHLFVTKAMRDSLVEGWGLRGHTAVLHDRPPAHFHPASPAEMHEASYPQLSYKGLFPLFLSRFCLLANNQIPSSPTPNIDHFLPTLFPPNSQITASGKTIPTSSLFVSPSSSFTSSDALAALREDRPALVVTSTSWTADEDFDLLIEALRSYEGVAREVNAGTDRREEEPEEDREEANGEEGLGKEKERGEKRSGKLPKLLMLVTGKGENRDKYMEKIIRLEIEEKWEWVRCRSVWLSSGAYPILLGSADLGISLHSSSSGLDLPMKVVDMFGCGLPVCALHFECLDELVRDGVNGVVFRTASELAGHLQRLLLSFPNGKELENLRTSLRESITRFTRYPSAHHPDPSFSWGTWTENWDRIVRPLVVADAQHR
ncbi:uncharacterized protein EI90DRAFT_3147152 [Cantharellus anzutake]|uniref:uncharacterized protein n=1 Tax=Cantharellus anzutake TaxID=1750568 RepID=UPI001904F889|nr:uncharacterized protein EI90DRAFT_3147152 [Cantharellus anzutake]KAF8320593.1 hypothetical protein EI90DRAFT_3147152 [Cantharellus anzutake]